MATLPGLPDPSHPEDDPQGLPVEPEMDPKTPGAPIEEEAEPLKHHPTN